MKLSNYNFLVEIEDGKTLAYNALRNGLCMVNEEIKKVLQNFDENFYSKLDEDLKNELLRGGFVVPDQLDEIHLIKVRRNLQNYSTQGIALTICPTLDCNLRCKYCYESLPLSYMSKKVQDDLLEWVKKRMDQKTRAFFVCWYGGEPLLAFDVIENLSREFISLCDENKIKYSADIITNGTLLDSEKVEKLKQLKVNFIQVTLDGFKEAHDKRRPFKDGKGSYDMIIKNLSKIGGLIRVSLRVNIDTTNVEESLDFVSELINEEWFKNGNFDIHFGYIKKYTESCGCEVSETLKPNDFWKLNLKLNEILETKGIGYPIYPDISTGCTATNINSYVVGPEGEFYKCWNNVDDKAKTSGSIYNAEPEPIFYEYLLSGFEEFAECLKCKCLPICGGGCVDARVRIKKGEYGVKDCSMWKFFMEENLKRYFMWWWKEKEKESKKEKESQIETKEGK